MEGNGRVVNDCGQDGQGDLYAMNTNIGASNIEGEHLRALNADMNLIDMVESAEHYLWFTSRNGIFRFARDDFSRPGSSGEEPTHFNSNTCADGLTPPQ